MFLVDTVLQSAHGNLKLTISVDSNPKYNPINMQTRI